MEQRAFGTRSTEHDLSFLYIHSIWQKGSRRTAGLHPHRAAVPCPAGLGHGAEQPGHGGSPWAAVSGLVWSAERMQRPAQGAQQAPSQKSSRAVKGSLGFVSQPIPLCTQAVPAERAVKRRHARDG